MNEDLCELGFLFGSLGLFWLAAHLAGRSNSFTFALAVLLSVFGFLGGGCYGDRMRPSGSWGHFQSVAFGALGGIAIGTASAVLVRLAFAIRRLILKQVFYMERPCPVSTQNLSLRNSARQNQQSPEPERSAQEPSAQANAKIRATPPPRLLLSHFTIQQFLRDKINRN
jgi:hypothetical protein